MYIVAMQPYWSRLWQFRQLLCVAAMSSYKFDMDTEKQRQRRSDNARLRAEIPEASSYS